MKRVPWSAVLLCLAGAFTVRRLLAVVLMLGTLAGTVWTFSAGALTLSGAGERLVSVGGVAVLAGTIVIGVLFVALTAE